MKRTSWLTLSLTLAVVLGALAVEAQRRRQPRPPKNRPRMADTVKANIYADNWFMMYINGKLIAVDSIEFVPHNIISVDILPEYPMTVAVLARDFADAQTGLEYNNTRIGDGGFILKFGDGTVTSEGWKAKKVFWGRSTGTSATLRWAANRSHKDGTSPTSTTVRGRTRTSLQGRKFARIASTTTMISRALSSSGRRIWNWTTRSCSGIGWRIPDVRIRRPLASVAVG